MKRALLIAGGISALLAVLVVVVVGNHRAAPDTVAPVLAPPVGSLSASTNVVLVVGCTTRADQLTPWGAPGNVTPFLEAQAQRGTRFAHTIAAAPWTRPSLTAIFTGRHAHGIGMTEPNGGRSRKVLPPDVSTIGELMKASGRRTFGGTANPNADIRFGMARGFDSYVDVGEGWTETFEAKIEGDGLVQATLDFAAESDAPFFAQLVLVEAHAPDHTTAWQRARFRGTAGSPRLEAYRARLRDLDDLLAELAEGLEAQGHGEDTLFVFVGDHGEGLNHPRHHGHGHGRYLYPSSVHVPWLMWGPGIARGHVVEGLGSQVDVLPTLVELLGLRKPVKLQGLSRAVEAAGAQIERPDRRVYADTWFRAAVRSAIYTPTRMCQRDYRQEESARVAEQFGKKGRVLPDFPDACFDWRQDPEMTVALSDPALVAALERWRGVQRRLRLPYGDGVDVDDSDINDALEALGYVE